MSTTTNVPNTRSPCGMNNLRVYDHLFDHLAKNAHDGNPIVGIVRDGIDNYVNHDASWVDVYLMGNSGIFPSATGGMTALHVLGNSNATKFVSEHVGRSDADEQWYSIGRNEKHAQRNNSVHNTGNMFCAHSFGIDVQVVTTIVDFERGYGTIMLYSVPREDRVKTHSQHKTIACSFKVVDGAPVFMEQDTDQQGAQLDHFHRFLRESPFHDGEVALRTARQNINVWIGHFLSDEVRGEESCLVSNVYLADSLTRGDGTCLLRYSADGNDILFVDNGRCTSLRTTLCGYFEYPKAPVVVNGMMGKSGNAIFMKMTLGGKVDLLEPPNDGSVLENVRATFLNPELTQLRVVTWMRANAEDLQATARRIQMSLGRGDRLEVYHNIIFTAEHSLRKDGQWISGNVDVQRKRIMDADVDGRPFENRFLPRDRTIAERKFTNGATDYNGAFVHPILKGMYPGLPFETDDELIAQFESDTGYTPEIYFTCVFANVAAQKKDALPSFGTARTLTRILNGEGVVMVTQLDNFTPSLSKKGLDQCDSRKMEINALKLRAVVVALPLAFEGKVGKRMEWIKSDLVGAQKLIEYRYQPLIRSHEKEHEDGIEVDDESAAPSVAQTLVVPTVVGAGEDVDAPALKRQKRAARSKLTRQSNQKGCPDTMMEVWQGLLEETRDGSFQSPALSSTLSELLENTNPFSLYPGIPRGAETKNRHAGLAVHQLTAMAMWRTDLTERDKEILLHMLLKTLGGLLEAKLKHDPPISIADEDDEE